MIITYFGDQCFRVENGPTSILIDSTNNRLKGDIVLRTSTEPDAVPVEKTELTFAGEYEVGGIEIRGVEIKGESTAKELKTVFSVSWEGVNLVFLGSIAEPLPSEIIDQLGEADVLFIPTGSGALAPEAAVSLVKKMDPRYVIPYGSKGVGDFLKKIGQSGESQDKIVFKKKDLADVEQKVILLSSNS